VAKEIKEKHSYCAKDPLTEFAKWDKMEIMDGRQKKSKRFKKFVTESMRSGNKIEIDIGYECFLGPEMFFKPVSKDLLISEDNLVTPCRSSLMPNGGNHWTRSLTTPSRTAR